MSAAEFQRRQDEFVAKIRSRYPRFKTLSAALLEEICSGKEQSSRERAALHFGLIGSRRGLSRLQKLVELLRFKVEASGSYWSGPPERTLLYSILYAIAAMDTEASHDFLTQILHESPSQIVRADVLEAMSYEKRRFDPELVLPSTSSQTHPPEILSALYALYCNYYATVEPERARQIATPLLSHSHPMVRAFCIELLQADPENLGLIASFQDDPDPNVRMNVADAIQWIQDSMAERVKMRLPWMETRSV